ncbi:DnaT-like ssDNA-binding domain-containing protein [Litoribrevibacter euphylliae]|uniref:DnaT-like ssDNA-binding domain-containing protein n=1 Tax=Litoribrevibacter euphylliae TaxID=1834034 RepID=A0ABV7HIF3_9GAMM
MGDHLIHFSADLARSHGLDQAIAYSVMKQFQEFRQNKNGWVAISDEEWQAKLPFWTLENIHRALNQLRIQNLLEIHQTGNTLTPKCLYRLIKTSPRPQGLPIVESVPRSTNAHGKNTQNQNAAFSRSGPMPDQWHPDPHVLQQLTRLGIPENFIQEAVPEFVTYWRDSGKHAISWGAKFQERVRKLWMEHETKVASNKIPAPITKDWHPSQDAMDILVRDGIDPEFIKDSVAEFLLYWIERGSAEITWNNKFVSHIRHQWQKFCSTIEHSTNPTRIPKNWQPSQECYEIARMAQIDGQFAQEQVKPFVLYWSDTNQTSTSWNTKFVQHLKWSWAKRHQLENIGQSVGHEKGSGNHQSGHSTNQSFIQRHQDTSWADEL